MTQKTKPMRHWFDDTHTTESAVLERISTAVDVIFSSLRKYHTPQAVNAKLGLTDAETTLEVKADWANDLAVLTPQMIHRGLKKARSQDWCPTLGQFITLCKPSPEEAFFEAQTGIKDRSRGLMGKWSCPAVYWAAIEFGAMEIKQAQWSFHGKRWAKFLNDAMDKQEAGRLDEIPQPVAVNARLGNDSVKGDPSVARAAMEKINNMVQKTAGRNVFSIGGAA